MIDKTLYFLLDKKLIFQKCLLFLLFFTILSFFNGCALANKQSQIKNSLNDSELWNSKFDSDDWQPINKNNNPNLKAL